MALVSAAVDQCHTQTRGFTAPQCSPTTDTRLHTFKLYLTFKVYIIYVCKILIYMITNYVLLIFLFVRNVGEAKKVVSERQDTKNDNKSEIK